MILSNVEIFKALDSGRLIIKPQPTPRQSTVGGPHCPYDTHSVDLRLGRELSVPVAGAYAVDHTQGKLVEHIARNSKTFQLTPNQPYLLNRDPVRLGHHARIHRATDNTWV